MAVVGGSHVSLGATSGQLRVETRACEMCISILRQRVMRWRTLDAILVNRNGRSDCRNCIANLIKRHARQLTGRNGHGYPGKLTSGAQEHRGRGQMCQPTICSRRVTTQRSLRQASYQCSNSSRALAVGSKMVYLMVNIG